MGNVSVLNSAAALISFDLFTLFEREASIALIWWRAEIDAGGGGDDFQHPYVYIADQATLEFRRSLYVVGGGRREPRGYNAATAPRSKLPHCRDSLASP